MSERSGRDSSNCKHWWHPVPAGQRLEIDELGQTLQVNKPAEKLYCYRCGDTKPITKGQEA